MVFFVFSFLGCFDFFRIFWVGFSIFLFCFVLFCFVLCVYCCKAKGLGVLVALRGLGGSTFSPFFFSRLYCFFFCWIRAPPSFFSWPSGKAEEHVTTTLDENVRVYQSTPLLTWWCCLYCS